MPIPQAVVGAVEQVAPAVVSIYVGVPVIEAEASRSALAMDGVVEGLL